MKRKSLEADLCPVARALDAIGDWWSLLIVRDAMMGASRFSEFQKNLGVAKNILSARLRTLVEQDILELEAASDGSAYRKYVLTEKGRGLFPVLVALRQWAEEFSFQRDEVFSKLLDQKTRQPLRKLEIRAVDGRLLSQSDTMVLMPASA